MAADSFLLSPIELTQLVGSSRVSSQTTWLRSKGIPFEIGKDGKAKVLRAAVEARLMPSSARQRAKTEPNLAALKKAS